MMGTEMDKDAKGLVAAVLSPAAIAAFVVLSAWEGRVISDAWRWLIMPAFPAVPAVPWTAATGCALIVGLVKYAYKKPEEPESESVGAWAMRVAVAPVAAQVLCIALYWGAAYVIARLALP